jgi:hypothetical protein
MQSRFNFELVNARDYEDLRPGYAPSRRVGGSGGRP